MLKTFSLLPPMAEIGVPRNTARNSRHRLEINAQKPPRQDRNPPSWSLLRDLFACKQLEFSGVKRRSKKIGCSGSLCRLRDNNRVMQRPENSPDAVKKCIYSKNEIFTNGGCGGNGFRRPTASIGSYASEVRSISESSVSSKAFSCSSNSSAIHGGSLRRAHLKRLTGCYECHTLVDPINGGSKLGSPRGGTNSCEHCPQIFINAQTLELHLSTKHAVTELGPDDSSRNIVEIIFQSSWLKRDSPVCRIDRILKVHNSQKTIDMFEDYRDCVKAKATKLARKNARCIADGNELLRFLCTTFICSIGIHGNSNLCDSIADCNVCNIIKNGFRIEGSGGICTTASSGKAHDSIRTGVSEKRAMLVCRLIAGRIKRNHESVEEVISCAGYDSVAGRVGLGTNCSHLDELYVFNAKAILPCFVVIYRSIG